MAEFLEFRNQTQDILKASADLAKRLGFSSSEEIINGQLEALKKKEFMVVVAGEAKRGKSSLLNAFLNEKDALFPVDINLCTNVVTIVRYGGQESVEAYIEDSRAKNGCRVEKIRREQISDYVSEKGNPNNYRQVKMLNIRVPNELLKEGVVFVDTPGVGSLNIEHAETTYGFLPYADVLLFVSDADSGLTQSELIFLRRGYKYCKNILFPLTKKDLNENYNIILEDNREKISKTLNISAKDVQITAVSSTAKLRYLKSGSKTMLKNSNYAALEEAVWSSIFRHRGEALLLPFLTAARNELLKLADNITAQYQLLDEDQEVVQKLIKKLKEETAELDCLQEKGADWRNQLSLFFSTLQNDMSVTRQQIDTDAREIVDKRHKDLDDKICKEENYKKLVGDVNDRISCGVLDIRDEIDSKVKKKMDELERQMNFRVSVNKDILNKMGYTPKKDLGVTFPTKKIMDKAIDSGRKIGVNGMGGGTIGSVLGGFVGFCVGGPAGIIAGAQIGGAVGGLAGGAKGCVDALTQYDQLDVNAVIRALTQHITTSMTNVNASINNTISELRVSVSASYEEKLKNRAKNLRENTAQMQKNITMTGSEISKKRETLKKQSAELASKLNQFEKLEQAVCSFGESGFEEAAAAKKMEDGVGMAKGDKEATDKKTADKEKVSYGFL